MPEEPIMQINPGTVSTFFNAIYFYAYNTHDDSNAIVWIHRQHDIFKMTICNIDSTLHMDFFIS